MSVYLQAPSARKPRYSQDDLLARSGSPNAAASTLSLGQYKSEEYPLPVIQVLQKASEPEDVERSSPIPQGFREPLAEFFGAMLLSIMITGVSCQVSLSSNNKIAGSPAGDFLASTLASGFGVGLGIYSTAKVSGGHLNPMISFTMAIFRGFPPKKFLPYVFAQIMGALVGSLLIYGIYGQAIAVFEAGERTVPGTAAFFAPFAPDYANAATWFFSEVLASALFAIVIFTATDKRNNFPAELFPLLMPVAVTGMAGALGLQGAEMNPARTLGPRFMAAMFYGKEVLGYRKAFWIYTTLFGEFVGGFLGALVYEICIASSETSPLAKLAPSSRGQGRPRSDSDETKV